MIVLRDLYLEYEGLSAQIDYFIITRKHQYVVECKNLYGNIEINNSGDFIRTVTYGRHTKKEGIYSPITQNRRHLELIKQIRINEKSNIVTKTIFEKYFYDNYRSIVVLANPKTVLFDENAKKEVREQVIRVDQISQYIRETDANPKAEATSEKKMEELAQFFLRIHKKQKMDYTEKFRTTIESVAKATIQQPERLIPSQAVKAPDMICPKCGASMVKRKAVKGTNSGKEFYGCSNYPKCRGIINIQ